MLIVGHDKTVTMDKVTLRTHCWSYNNVTAYSGTTQAIDVQYTLHFKHTANTQPHFDTNLSNIIISVGLVGMVVREEMEIHNSPIQFTAEILFPSAKTESLKMSIASAV
jgi:hypothetical protein